MLCAPHHHHLLSPPRLPRISSLPKRQECCHARARLIDSRPPPLKAQQLRASGSSLLFLFSYLSLSLEEKLSPGLLPCSTSSFPGGDDWASGGPALCRRRARPPGMPLQPLLFPCAVRDGALQTLTKLSVFGYNILSYLLTWISFARTRIIGCPCPMLGPPLQRRCRTG